MSGIRDSTKARSLWGMMRGVGGVRKSIHQSWLVKGLGLGLLCWGFKGVQEEIPREEASTLQIGSVASVHNSILVTDYSTKMGIKTVRHPPYSPDLAANDFWLFPKLRGCCYETIEEMKEAVTKVIDNAHTRGLPWGPPEVVGTASEVVWTAQQVHCSRRRLLRRGLEFHLCTINRSAHTKKNLETYFMNLIYIYTLWLYLYIYIIVR